MMTKRLVTLYDILGIRPDAEVGEIRLAYRHLARRHHPDAGGDPEIMVALNRAWTILRDPGRRRSYDLERVQRAAGNAGFTKRPEPEVPTPVGRPFGTVLDFGRYTGWTVGQLSTYDPDYLLWLERTSYGRILRREIDATLQRVAA
jgi:curved DNA-binding protein CbpA